MTDDRDKYLITARVTANGVIERSDVVGAIFGQTEGLLSDRLDLRSLQDAERVGRLDVDVSSADGRSTGSVTIATSLDRVETAIIAAALETIEQIGPCRATVHIERIEDVRAAKRQEVVDRARELLAIGFEDSGLTSREVIERVRRDASISDIEEYAGYPAGPEVETADHVILVEGRADVRRLLQFGIKNAIGVEGTDVPPEIVALTAERTVTAFFDGDRGGDLLLLELAQVGDVDYVTFAPPGRSVEDLSHAEVHSALQERVPYEGARVEEEEENVGDPPTEQTEPAASDVEPDAPDSIHDHVEEVIGGATGEVRAISRAFERIEGGPASAVESLLLDASTIPYAIILDDQLDQSTVDIATRFGVEHIVARSLGEFTKRPVDVRVHEAEAVVDDLELPVA